MTLNTLIRAVKKAVGVKEWTYIIDCNNIKMNKKARYDMRYSQKEGVMVVMTNDWEDWKEFAELHTGMLNRKGIPCDLQERVQIFENLFHLGDKVQLYLACKDSKMLAGLVVMIKGNTAIFWKAGMTTEAKKHSPMSLLIYHVCNSGIFTGLFDKFDMNISPAADKHLKLNDDVGRIVRFKMSFGEKVFK